MTAVVTTARSDKSVALVAGVSALAVVVSCALMAPTEFVLIVSVWTLPVAAAASVDAATARLPDLVVLPGVAAVLTAAALVDRLALALLGAALLALPMLVVHLARPAGMGFGDVKFGLLLGAGVGAVAVPLVPLAFLLAAIVHAIACCALRCRDRLLPFGPALAVASGTILTLGLWRLR
jgi:leader peptidase (prepilin peptidase) / N-methyltransferase